MRKQVDLCNGPIFKGVIRYTLPIILTNVLQLLYNAADIIVVGRFCGSTPIAAVGASASVVHLLVGLFIGLSAGAGATIAHAIGAKDSDGVKKAVHTSLAVGLVGGVILTIVGVALSEPILRLLKTPEDVLPLAVLYMQIFFSGMIPNVFCFFAGAVINATGETQKPLKFLSFSGILNVILNVFFVTVFDMSVDGVALASILAQTCSALLFAKELVSRNDSCKLYLKEIRFHKKPLIKILAIGIPSGIQGCLFSFANTFVQSSVNAFGTAAVAGNSAAANIEGFVYTAMNSFSQTALVFTGQNLGAGKPQRIKQAMLTTAACAGALGLVLGASMFLFAKPLLSIYITDSAEAIVYGLQRMTLIGLLYFPCGIMECISATNRALGRATASMVICVFFVCVFRILWINSAFLLPTLHNFYGLFACFPISWIMCIGVQLPLFIFTFRKLKRKTL